MPWNAERVDEAVIQDTVGSSTLHTRPYSADPSGPHSIRCSDAMWYAAKARAKDEGVTLNRVLNVLLEAYALEVLNLPAISKHYEPPLADQPPSG